MGTTETWMRQLFRHLSSTDMEKSPVVRLEVRAKILMGK